jgi:hypothetical protein
MSRVGRWLREPVNVKPKDMDWRDFGRSFGRFAGGYLESGEEDTPSGRAWKRGGQDRSDGDPTPRWALMVALLIGVIFLSGLLYLTVIAGAW